MHCLIDQWPSVAVEVFEQVGYMYKLSMIMEGIIGNVLIFVSVVGVVWVYHKCMSNKSLIYKRIAVPRSHVVCEQNFLNLN